jgi:hypothetical protein
MKVRLTYPQAKMLDIESQPFTGYKNLTLNEGQRTLLFQKSKSALLRERRKIKQIFKDYLDNNVLFFD